MSQYRVVHLLGFSKEQLIETLESIRTKLFFNEEDGRWDPNKECGADAISDICQLLDASGMGPLRAPVSQKIFALKSLVGKLEQVEAALRSDIDRKYHIEALEMSLALWGASLSREAEILTLVDILHHRVECLLEEQDNG